MTDAKNLEVGQILVNRFSGKGRTITDVEVQGGIIVRVRLEDRIWLETYNLTNFKLLDPEGKEVERYGRNKPNVPESANRGSGIATGRNTSRNGATRTTQNGSRERKPKSK